jgi:hypothetical protein
MMMNKPQTSKDKTRVIYIRLIIQDDPILSVVSERNRLLKDAIINYVTS